MRRGRSPVRRVRGDGLTSTFGRRGGDRESAATAAGVPGDSGLFWAVVRDFHSLTTANAAQQLEPGFAARGGQRYSGAILHRLEGAAVSTADLGSPGLGRPRAEAGERRNSRRRTRIARGLRFFKSRTAGG